MFGINKWILVNNYNSKQKNNDIANTRLKCKAIDCLNSPDIYQNSITNSSFVWVFMFTTILDVNGNTLLCKKKVPDQLQCCYIDFCEYFYKVDNKNWNTSASDRTLTRIKPLWLLSLSMDRWQWRWTMLWT